MYQTSIRNKKKHSKFNRDKDMNYQINTDYEDYAYVIKLLGNCRARVLCNNGTEAIGVIRGALRRFNKRVLIENGDIIVISKRDFQDNKVDIVHKFNLDQCQSLIKNKAISDVLINCYYNKNSYSHDKNETHDDNYITFDDILPSSSSDEGNNDNDDDIKIDDV
jgi:translation initiation factor 1A